MYQQITIVGNVGRDPELRFTPQGVAVCDFSVAVNKRFTPQGGEPRDETTWFRVTCWRQLAETVAKYVRKGKQILIVGEVSASAYADKGGQPAATLEITAQTVKFLGTRDENDGGGGGRDTEDFRPVQQQTPERGGGGERSERGGKGNQRGGRNQPPPENSDDIPF